MSQTSHIHIAVTLDANKVPEKMEWTASQPQAAGAPSEAKAMLLSLFDKDTLDTLKIDLWTKDMQVNEMDKFFFQTLRALADTYFRATQNRALAADMQQFVQYFGEKTEVIPPAK